MKRVILIISIGLFTAFLTQSWYVETNQLCQENSLECNLTWMKDYLSLTEDQYEAVLSMHLNHESEVQKLTNQIAELQSRLDMLENNRINNDRIDFIAFYNYLQEKTSLNESVQDNTKDFLSGIGSLMTQEQSKRFNSLLDEFKETQASSS